MTYFVLEIQVAQDGTPATLITNHSSRDEALSKFHLILASAAVSQLRVHSAIVITEDGGTLRSESFRHAPDPEPDGEDGEEE